VLDINGQQQGDSYLMTFSVRDTGIGIAPEKQRVIFDAFAQADNSTTRRYGGTGLGLSITQKLVALLGGEIRVDSRPQQGSEFVFSIPLQLADKQAAARPPADLAGLHVLVCDDNPTNRSWLAALLKNWGMQATLAEDGFAALPSCNNKPSTLSCWMATCRACPVSRWHASCNSKAARPTSSC
jgi:hypothetical protein